MHQGDHFCHLLPAMFRWVCPDVSLQTRSWKRIFYWKIRKILKILFKLTLGVNSNDVHAFILLKMLWECKMPWFPPSIKNDMSFLDVTVKWCSISETIKLKGTSKPLLFLFLNFFIWMSSDDLNLYPYWNLKNNENSINTEKTYAVWVGKRIRALKCLLWIDLVAFQSIHWSSTVGRLSPWS